MAKTFDYDPEVVWRLQDAGWQGMVRWFGHVPKELVIRQDPGKPPFMFWQEIEFDLAAGRDGVDVPFYEAFKDVADATLTPRSD